MMKKIILCMALLISASVAWGETKVALVFDAGGKNDRSFNQSAWEGALKASNDFGITLKDVEPADTSAVEEAIRTFASQEFNLVVGVGFANAPSIEKVAKEFPDTHFAIVDSVVDLPNVASLVFKEQEGSYLVGLLAAERSLDMMKKDKKNKVVGFIGGMDIPLIHKFESGYIQGVKAIDSNIEVLVNYVGNTPTAWNDPAKAKEIANAQIAKGATVIYAAAGGSGNGLFDAIKEHNGKGTCLPQKKRCIYAIGVDSDQNYLVPGQILTSMLKRVDVAVYFTIKAEHEGKFQGGLNVFDLKSNGVGYSLNKYNEQLVTEKMRETADDYKDKIIKGQIQVKDTR